jgi:hypothetical protein
MEFEMTMREIYSKNFSYLTFLVEKVNQNNNKHEQHIITRILRRS